jgi:hypothetical protein
MEKVMKQMSKVTKHRFTNDHCHLFSTVVVQPNARTYVLRARGIVRAVPVDNVQLLSVYLVVLRVSNVDGTAALAAGNLVVLLLDVVRGTGRGGVDERGRLAHAAGSVGHAGATHRLLVAARENKVFALLGIAQPAAAGGVVDELAGEGLADEVGERHGAARRSRLGQR